MKNFLKKIIISSLLMLFVFQPFTPLISEAANSKAIEKEPLPPKTGKIELINKRTETSKTFLKSDGSKELVVSKSKIHFKNKSSKFEEIDPNLVEKKTLGLGSTGEFYSKKNDINLSFSKDLSKKAFYYAKDGASIEAKLKGVGSTKKNSKVGFSAKNLKKVKVEQKNNKVSYKNVSSNTDINYYSMPDGLKEDIIIKKYNGQNTFTFDFVLKGAYLQKQKDGSYIFYNSKTKEESFRMPAFYMWDSKNGVNSSKNAFSFDIKSEIKKNGDIYTLTLKADDKWLSSKDRVFPITIDPSVTSGRYEDSYTQSTYPWTSTWDQRALYIGRETYYGKGITRAFVDFNLPDLTGARILGGKVDAYQYNCYNSCTWSNVSAYSVNRDYDPWALYWGNQPGLHEKLGSAFSTYSYPNNGWLSMDVGNALRKWYTGVQDGSSVGSIAFASDTEGSSGWRTWASQNHPDWWMNAPKITIDYNDYNAYYHQNVEIPNMIAGTVNEVPITVVNTGRNWWNSAEPYAFKLGYHWVDNSNGQKIIQEGLYADLPYNVAPNGGEFTIRAKVKSPPKEGSYTLQWDMVHGAVTWFSNQGIATHNKVITVTRPSFSSMTHTGSESYYAKVGPVDIATGNLTFTDVDMNVSSETDQLVAGRTYNSNSSDLTKTFNHDANGYIRTWTLNGPYKEDDQSWRLVRPYITNEKLIKPSPGTTSGGIVWKDITEPNTSQMWLDWGLYATGSMQVGWATNVASYSNVYVYSPSSRNVLLKMGSDDGLKVWLNNKEVHFNDVYRGLTLDSDVIPVTLNSGWNQLMVKTSQGTHGYQMSARFTDGNGAKMDDLKYTTYNPDVFSDEKSLGKGWSASFDEKLYNFGGAYSYENNFTNGTDAAEMKPVTGSWIQENGVYKQTDSAVAQKWVSTKKAFMGTYTYEFDYKINSQTGTYNHAGAVIDWQPGTQSGYRISHLYTSWVISKWVNGIETPINGTLDQGISPVNGTVHLKIVRNTNTGHIYLYANGVWVTTVIDSSFKGGGVGFHAFDGIAEFDNVKVYTAPEEVYYRDGGGTVNVYTRNSDGSYKRPAGSTTNLVKNADNTLSLVDKSGVRINFGLDGKITSKVDLFGNTVSYVYSNGKLVKINDGAARFGSRYINFNYYPDGKLQSVVDQAGNVVNYAYDANGLLSKVTDPMGYSDLFEYNADGRIIKNTDKKSSVTTIGYNGNKVSTITDALGAVTTFSYSYLKTEIIDALNRKSSYGFNTANLLTSFINAKNVREDYYYNDNYDLVKTVYAPGYEENSTFDGNGNKLTEADPEGRKSVYEYLNNELTKSVDPKGKTTIYTYSTDGKRNLLSEKDPKGNITTYTYDIKGRKESATDPKGFKTTFGYNEFGDQTSVISAKGGTVKASYDLVGRKVSDTTELGKVTTYTYDKLSRLLSTVSPGGITSSAVFDAEGNKIKETDAKGASKSYEYDALGRLVKLKDEAGFFMTYAYDKVGNKTKVIDAKGKVTEYIYDELNQKTKELDPYKNPTTASYDNLGNMTSVTDAASQTVTQTVNKNGEVVAEVKPEGNTSINYDANGNATKVQGSSATKKIYENTFDKVADGFIPINGNWSVINGEYNQSTVSPEYYRTRVNGVKFSDGTLEFKIKRNNNVVEPYFRAIYRGDWDAAIGSRYSYYVGYIGSVWRISRVIEGQPEEYYQVPGTLAVNTQYNVKAVVSGTNTKLYVNGALILDKNLSGGKTEGNVELWTYNTNASFDDLSITSTTDTNVATFDENNNLVKTTNNTIGEVTKTVDENNNQTAVTTPTSRILFGYDANQQNNNVSTHVMPSTVQSQATIMAMSTTKLGIQSVSTLGTVSTMSLGTNTIERDAEGKVTTITKANGDKTIYEYDAIVGRVISVKNVNKNGLLLASYGYSYDAESNQSKITNNVGQIFNYGYDVKGQLTNDNGKAITYDPMGNRISYDGVTYTYDEAGDANRLLKAVYPNGKVTTFEYDKKGNATKKTDTINGVVSTTLYSYDSDDYFVKAVLPNGKIIQYIYDKEQKRRIQRTEKEVSGAEKVTKFVYDEDRLVSETDLKGNIIRSYAWDEDEQLLSVTIPDSSNVLKTYYYIKNAKGDITGMTDADGNKVAEYSYDSWGNILSATTVGGTDPEIVKKNPRRYASYWYDDSLGQYFMKVRMYDPEIGRFYSKDPVISEEENTLEYNPYIYCANNPITRIDPDGKFWQIVTAAVGAGIGGAYSGVKAYKEGKRGWQLAGSIAVGAGTGALTGSGIGLIAKAGVGVYRGAKAVQRLRTITYPVRLKRYIKSNQVAINRAVGLRAEARVTASLIKRYGVRNVMPQVSFRTPYGKRVYDNLVLHKGKRFAVEVKSGMARYSTLQRKKDAWLFTKRGIKSYLWRR